MGHHGSSSVTRNEENLSLTSTHSRRPAPAKTLAHANTVPGQLTDGLLALGTAAALDAPLNCHRCQLSCCSRRVTLSSVRRGRHCRLALHLLLALALGCPRGARVVLRSFGRQLAAQRCGALGPPCGIELAAASLCLLAVSLLLSASARSAAGPAAAPSLPLLILITALQHVGNRRGRGGRCACSGVW